MNAKNLIKIKAKKIEYILSKILCDAPMLQNFNYIWYASYGSNILEERFLCYIRGGQPTGSNTTYDGCADKSLPIKKDKICINSELYFAKESISWNRGGVCFIRTNSDLQFETLGKMYLIKNEQFIDVVRQETKNTNQLDIDFKSAISEGSIIFKKNSWYGNLIHLGIKDNYPIFTFTNEDNLQNINKPDETYLKIIICGIRETYGLNTVELFNYFISKRGIAGNFTGEYLTQIIETTAI